MLMTRKPTALQLNEIQSLMQDLSCNHIEGINNKSVVIDTGCSRSASAFEDDFIEGTLVPLREPFTLSGIGHEDEFYDCLSVEADQGDDSLSKQDGADQFFYFAGHTIV